MGTALLSGSGWTYREQDEGSIADWGDHRGTTLAEVCRLFQPDEVVRDLILPTVAEAMDTGKLMSYDVAVRGGSGRTTVMRVDGVLLTRWDWITGPPPASDFAFRLGLLAEHLDRLAWALLEGRPLPPTPAALSRGDARLPASLVPAPSAP